MSQQVQPKFSILKKLIRYSIQTIVFTSLICYIISIVLSIINGHKTYTLLENNIRHNLISKGITLIKNNSVALSGMAEDNAFHAIEDLVSTTVEDDEDIIEGIYMDDTRIPWVIAGKGQATQSINRLSPKAKNDPRDIWTDSLIRPSYTIVTTKSIDLIDFGGPVQNMEQRLGSIRYTFTTESMRKTIDRMKKTVWLNGVFSLVVFFVAAALLLLVQSGISKKYAEKFTRPLQILTDSARSIEQGNYSDEITITTDDEIGILSHSFEEMRKKIRRYVDNLERLVEERTSQLRTVQQELLDKAHKAGMADVATETLHNVGNILNSITTSMHLLQQAFTRCPTADLSRALTIIREHGDDIPSFLNTSQKAEMLIRYLLKLDTLFGKYQIESIEHLDRLSLKVQMIADVIAAQQAFTMNSQYTRTADVHKLIEDALTMQSGSFEKYRITCKRVYGQLPEIQLQPNKFIHVIINILKNAEEAMFADTGRERIITIRTSATESFVQVEIKDTGHGVTKKEMEQIFTYGYTTKPDGHGFGLHSCANYITEMKGQIWAESEGHNTGTTLFIKLPIHFKETTT